MSIGEGCTHGRETVNIWRFRLRVSIEMADPMIQVIDRDEKHIGLFFGEQKTGEKTSKYNANIPDFHNLLKKNAQACLLNHLVVERPSFPVMVLYSRVLSGLSGKVCHPICCGVNIFVAPDAIANVGRTTPKAMKNKLLIMYPLTIIFFSGVIYRFASLFSNSMDLSISA